MNETEVSFKLLDEVHQKYMEKKIKEAEEQESKRKEELKKLEKAYKSRR